MQLREAYMGELESMRRAMEEGIANGEWFEIVYHGGSNPGAKRKIAPIKILGDQVRARCYTSNAVKPFVLAKIDILAVGQEAATVPQWAPGGNPDDLAGVVDVRDIHRVCNEALAAKGWVVRLSELDEGWELELFARWKNGKLRKTPTHVLGYFHTTSDASHIYDPKPVPVRTNIRPRVRPWTLKGKTFKSPRVPVVEFLKLAALEEGEIRSLLRNAANARV
jgi:hypothetical protein